MMSLLQNSAAWRALPLALALLGGPAAAADGVFRYARIEDVPKTIRDIVNGLPDCAVGPGEATRQPFGTGRVLFAIPCPPTGKTERRVFVLAADDSGTSPNVVMFPPPGSNKQEPLHELSNPEIVADSREITHRATTPGETPCRTEGRWKIDDRGNAAIVSWRTAKSCSGDDWSRAAASAAAKPHRAAARHGRKGARPAAHRGSGRKTMVFTPRHR
jgi:hypothetical protein